MAFLVSTRRDARPGLLAGLRIRIKLIVLHTCFSLALAGILVVALLPAISEVVKQAESHEAGVVLAGLLGQGGTPLDVERPGGAGLTVRRGSAFALGIDGATAARLTETGATEVLPSESGGGIINGLKNLGRGPAPVVVGFDKATGEFVAVSVVLQGARDAVIRLYLLVTIALLAVYALVAVALEMLVLPKHVYQPIRTMLEADAALQEGRFDAEIIPDSAIPADELGEIMRSRNRSILAVRRHEADLADALNRLEEVATDLKRKNHLLEMTRRNMADADRLASLGLMSAGIAHELNTPLAVLKGLVEKSAKGVPVSASESALMLRVVGRLERLSESLLDFARVRPASSSDTALRPLVDEAWTLVRLDRGSDARSIEFTNEVPADLHAWCDADRMVQVLVNLLRNAADAIAAARTDARSRQFAPRPPQIVVAGERIRRAEVPREWASLTVTDNGPGIDRDVLPRLFEPFASTRLDSKGTGLGLAVAEGIVREQGGVVLARNRTGPPGAVFEIVLPICEPADRSSEGPGVVDGHAEVRVDSAPESVDIEQHT
jgi:signal transduction histidine kinase